ncbi:MAG: hypothetical protein AB7O67_23435 [Vicinamibacterales bacterium]
MNAGQGVLRFPAGAVTLSGPVTVHVDGRIPSDPILGQALADRGLDQVARGADGEWSAWAWQALEQVCRTQGDVTADDVWLIMQRRALADGRELPTTPNHSAMGAIFNAAHKREWLEPTTRCRASARPNARKRAFRVWISRLYVRTPIGGAAAGAR